MSTTDNSQRLTFKKGERLKSRKTIQTLFDQNSSIKSYPFKLVWINEPNIEKFTLKMGVSVSKKIFKTAVKRNRIKRKMRECLRLNKSIIQNKIVYKKMNLSFMILYIGSDIVTYNEFDSKIKQLLIRLTDIINKISD